MSEEITGKTEDHLYLWALDPQHYLSENIGKLLRPSTEAVREFIEGVEL